MVTEAQFQETIIQLARTLGWLCYHTHDSRRSEPGFLDLVMVKGGRLIFAEIKDEDGALTLARLDRKGRLMPGQLDWFRTLRKCNVEVYLWRPDDWESIVTILGRGR